MSKSCLRCLHRLTTASCQRPGTGSVPLHLLGATSLMHEDRSPVFFVGVPRSGTTISFEHFSSHPDLAWVSNYARVFPTFHEMNLIRRLLDNRFVQIRGRKNQFNEERWINRYLPRPDESYEFWNAHACPGFDRAYLLNTDATEEERQRLRQAFSKIQRYQGRSRITAKMTGPGRIQYLNSVWPQMYVVHIIRDGFGVVKSLLNVPFWKKGGGSEAPWWHGGVSVAEVHQWREEGAPPELLAALQWRKIIETTRLEAKELLGHRYIELKYEDFLAAPRESIEQLYDQVGLDTNRSQIAELQIRNKQYTNDWGAAEREQLAKWMMPLYEELGYRSPKLDKI